MTFLEILQDAYDRTGNSQTQSGTAVSRQFKRYVNRWHRKILTTPGMASLRKVSLTQASVASQATYGIALQSIRSIVDPDNDERLTEKSEGWYRDTYPDPSADTGTPTHWVPLGLTRVKQQPSGASELFVKSTEAADTGTVKATVIRTNGLVASLSVVLTGATAVSLSATITDIVAVQDWYLSAAQTGVVTLHEDSGAGTELARLPIGQTYPRYLQYALAPTPSGVITYTINGIVSLVDLVQDTDEPLITSDFHDLLVDGCVYEEWLNKGRMREAQTLRGEIEGRIRALRASLWTFDQETTPSTRTFDESITLPIS